MSAFNTLYPYVRAQITQIIHEALTMSPTTCITATIAIVAIVIIHWILRKCCKSKTDSDEDVININQFPDTSIITMDAVCQQSAEKECAPENEAELALLLERLLTEMKFKQVPLGLNPHRANKKELVFEYELQFGDLITILSSIQKDGDTPFCRKNIKVALTRDDGFYLNHPMFPELSVIDHAKGNFGKIFKKLAKKIDVISAEIKKEYKKLFEVERTYTLSLNNPGMMH